MAAMVIVNNPGDWRHVFAPLLHADWHGWTPTDLVFPFFLFIVGVAITLAQTSGGTWVGVLRRGILIFALGLFLSGFPFFNTATWRIPGVLQRIALCYVTAVLIARAIAIDGADERRQITRLAIVLAAVLVLYAALMFWVPAPGGRPGDLSPAGNLAAWLDRRLMRGHLWKPDWDPEGLLSTLPAIATTLLGVMAGRARGMAAGLGQWRRRLIVGGTIALALGLLWNPWFPINKNLWTSSYVLFTGGLAALALAFCSLWADRAPAGSWRERVSEPFVALGRNAILLFVVSGLAARIMGLVIVDPARRQSLKTWLYATLFQPVASPKVASLLFALANLVLLYALLAWLHRRRVYWKV